MDKTNKIRSTSFHMHTEGGSRFDAVSRVKAAAKRLYELGATAMVVTDHGMMSAIEDAKDAIAEINEQNAKMKLIPGVEAYYEEDDDITHRKHLILVAKDVQGYHAIAKAVTKSFARMDSKNMPRMNTAILTEMFGEGSEGHGHVIATSACMAGVLASVLLTNKYIDKDVTSLEKKVKKLYSPNSPMYLKNLAKVQEIEDNVNDMSIEIKELDKIAKKPFKKKENALKAFEGTAEYDERKAALDAEKKESEDAATRAEELKESRKRAKLEQKKIKDHCKEEEKDHEKWKLINAQIEKLASEKVSDEELINAAELEAKRFEDIFGKGDFYCEVQNHRIPDEMYVMPIIANIAKKLNIPLVAANDAHMITNSEDEIKARQIMRSLRFNKWEQMDESDRELYIKTDDELSSILEEILPADVVEEAMKGIDDIVAACNVEFKKENHYPKFKTPFEGMSAKDYLAKLANEGIEWRYPERNGWNEEHQQRMEYELSIIDKLGVCDYLCIVEDFLRYGRLLGKLDLNDQRYLDDPYNMDLLKEITGDNVGLGIGPGRGSAVGSLVCYLIGITGIDPMKYNLIFERFLNAERVTMPKIYWASNVNPIAQGCVA